MNPMDTAPRNGARFMAKWPADENWPEEWVETWFGKWNDSGAWLSDDYVALLGDEYAPTEWRPL